MEILQDDRSMMSSGDSSDESSGVEVASPSNLHEQILRHQRKQQQKEQHQQQQHNSHQTQLPQKQSQQSQIQIREELAKGFANNNNLNNLLCPAALANLPQEVLLNLVQSGHLQVEEEGIFCKSYTHFHFLPDAHFFIDRFNNIGVVVIVLHCYTISILIIVKYQFLSNFFFPVFYSFIQLFLFTTVTDSKSCLYVH